MNTFGHASGAYISQLTLEAEEAYHNLWDVLVDWLEEAESAQDWLQHRLPVVMSVVECPTLEIYSRNEINADEYYEDLYRIAPRLFPLVMDYMEDVRRVPLHSDPSTYWRLGQVHDRINDSRNMLLWRVAVMA